MSCVAGKKKKANRPTSSAPTARSGQLSEHWNAWQLVTDAGHNWGILWFTNITMQNAHVAKWLVAPSEDVKYLLTWHLKIVDGETMNKDNYVGLNGCSILTPSLASPLYVTRPTSKWLWILEAVSHQVIRLKIHTSETSGWHESAIIS